ncbi:hypothetical protein EV715DRAFT_298325 [Schizophyllum commune]
MTEAVIATWGLVVVARLEGGHRQPRLAGLSNLLTHWPPRLQDSSLPRDEAASLPIGITEWDNPVAPLGLSSLYPVATSTTFILSEPPASSEGQATVA